MADQTIGGFSDGAPALDADQFVIQRGATANYKLTGQEIATLVAGHFVAFEAAGGTVNGTNSIFTAASTIAPSGSEIVYYNAIPTTNYTASGLTITLGFAPQTGDTVHITYWK